MRQLPSILFTLGLLLPTSLLLAQTPVDLRCEHLTNPLGIDSPHPRLTWKIADSRPGAKQTAWQIIVSSSLEKCRSGQADIWDSGKVENDATLHAYNGPALAPFTPYFWSVTVWDKDGHPATATEPAAWETAMLSSANWQGKWISDARDIRFKPAPYLRRAFALKKPIARARAYVAAGGLFEFSVNGQKIGTHALDPMYTRFDRRNLYLTFDITSALQPGENALGLILGNGWYNHQSLAVWDFEKAPWRNRPRALINVRLYYADGSEETIVSDAQWRAGTGSVVFNSIYTGEHQDARLAIPGWDKPGFDDSRWAPATPAPAPSNHLVAQQLHPVRHIAEIAPVRVQKIDARTTLFSFPENMAGVTRLQLRGPAGTVVRVKHGEILDEHGRLFMPSVERHYRAKGPQGDAPYLHTLAPDQFLPTHYPADGAGDPFGTDVYVLSGGDDTFAPKFNYKGFQYVEVHTSEPLPISSANLTALKMHSDVPPLGEIASSNPTLDKIWAAGNRAYLANLFGYPTDCPQREKNGWTGDAHIAIDTALYGFDVITVYEKWLADHRDEQRPDGTLPSIIPTGGWGYAWGNGPDWTSTIAIIPWQLYLFTGDSRPLQEIYPHLKRYVERVKRDALADPDYITGWGLGDWVPVKSRADKRLTSTLYFYVDASILSQTAALLGQEDDAKEYAELAEKIKIDLNAKFLDREKAIYCSGFQTELAAPLYWGFVPEEIRAKVAANLNRAVVENNYFLDTGILGAKCLLGALSNHGYADTAYRVAAQEKHPSWGWWIVNGATTFYENWDINDIRGDASRNHIMFGEINAWLFKTLGGIRPDPANPGFKHFFLHPEFPMELAHFSASHRSPHGEIISAWRRTRNTVEYRATVPPNTTATFSLRRADWESLQPQADTPKLKESGNAEFLRLTLSAGEYRWHLLPRKK